MASAASSSRSLASKPSISSFTLCTWRKHTTSLKMKSTVKEVITSILATLLFAVLLCGLYPVVVWSISQLIFPHQANGSLIEGPDRKIVGSEWLREKFTNAKLL